MPVIKLSLLGAPQLEHAGEPLAISRRKAMALLIYLAMLDAPQSRETLAALLWPESDAKRASASLRNTLWSLKQVLGEDWSVADGENIGLKPDADIWLDVAEFRRLLAQAAIHDHGRDEVCSECERLLMNAVALYGDDFLTGFTLPDCPQFDEWQFFQGQELRQALTGTLQRLIQWHSSQDRYEAALPFGCRWVSLDPLHEPAQRRLIWLYAMAGQRAAALRQYQLCRRLLSEELGVAPSQKTEALYQQILHRSVGTAVIDTRRARLLGCQHPRTGSAPG